MSRIERIKNILNQLNPKYLKIDDQTIAHHGHIADNSTETHLSITIYSDSLLHKTKVEQHRIINTLLHNEFDNGLHALTISVLNREPE